MSRQTDGTKRVTITDVAESLGVSPATVSRALSRPDRVSSAMRERVLTAADGLGYRPNVYARSLISGKTRTIALVLHGATNPYFFGLIRGHQAQSRASGYRTFLFDTDESAEVEAATLADLATEVDGAIVVASMQSDAALQATAAQFPIVMVNREIPDVPCVLIDSSLGFEQAMEHLASHGHERVAYLGGPPNSWSNKKRWEAIRRAARRLKMSARHLGPFAPSQASGAAAADAAIRYGATANLFFNDLLAIGALKQFRERGIRVPEDCSVVGCDDMFGADFCNPPLTTITAPIEQAGRAATDILLSSLPHAAIEGGAQARSRQTFTPHLTIRESTGPVASR